MFENNNIFKAYRVCGEMVCKYLTIRAGDDAEEKKIVYFGPLEEKAMGFNQKEHKVYKVKGEEITQISPEGRINEREQRMLEGIFHPKRPAIRKLKPLI